MFGLRANKAEPMYGSVCISLSRTESVWAKLWLFLGPFRGEDAPALKYTPAAAAIRVRPRLD